MNDIDLLKLAAKAAEIPLKPDFEERFDYYMQDRLMWNPLRDDGDALRLAVKLQICVLANRDIVEAVAWAVGAEKSREDLGDDHDAATRRAIVRAAAELGKKVVTPNLVARPHDRNVRRLPAKVERRCPRCGSHAYLWLIANGSQAALRTTKLDTATCTNCGYRWPCRVMEKDL